MRYFKVRFDGREEKAQLVPDCGVELIGENENAYETYSSREQEIVEEIYADPGLAIQEGWITETDQDWNEK